MAKISVDEYGSIQFEEVFNSITFKSPNGQVLAVCMRDNGFEIGLSDASAHGGHNRMQMLNWFSANEGQITRLSGEAK